MLGAISWGHRFSSSGCAPFSFSKCCSICRSGELGKGSSRAPAECFCPGVVVTPASLPAGAAGGRVLGKWFATSTATSGSREPAAAAPLGLEGLVLGVPCSSLPWSELGPWCRYEGWEGRVLGGW